MMAGTSSNDDRLVEKADELYKRNEVDQLYELLLNRSVEISYKYLYLGAIFDFGIKLIIKSSIFPFT